MNSVKLHETRPRFDLENIVNIMLTIKVFAAAALIGAASQSARSEEATPTVPAVTADQTATPANQTATPGTGHVPGWYPPTPDRRGYAQPWSQPSQWPAPPPGYGQLPPNSPPYGQYRTGPGVPVESPLSATLKQTQDQLAAKSTALDTTREKLAAQTTELETTREQLTKLQTEFLAATTALQKAQSDTINTGRQVDTTMTQVDTFKKILCELAARIETRKTALQNALQTTAAKPVDPDSAAAGEDESETTGQAEPQTDLQCSQLTESPAITSGQRGITVITQER